MLVSTLCWIVALAPACAAPSLEQELRSALAALPHSEARVGACVIELSTNRIVFSEGADTALTPASTMKLFVMAAALDELGAGFHFETIFATDGTNLLVIGDGDPGFGDEKIHRARNESISADFSRWADILLKRGIVTISGNLVIDESIFDDERLHPSWEQSDLDNWYAAPVAGLNFNDNCIDITVSPAEQRDTPVLVSVQPENTLVKIINKCRSGGDGTPILRHRYDSFEYLLNGRCRKRWRFSPVSFPDPALLFADALRKVLKERGITVAGTIERRRVRRSDGTLPPSLTVLAVRRTALTDVLRRAGKNSQNLFAECLLKRVGYECAKRRGKPESQGSWLLGRMAIMDLLQRAGIDTTGSTIADGSGLSRDNACTARQLAALLAWVRGRPFAQAMHDNLSIAGVDGSLRKRLKDRPGLVYAKTGTMRGVRTLAGYVDDDSGPRYAFAVLFNGYKGPSTPYRAIQDRFCRILISQRE